ncbi:sensor histidine kinase [Allocoleopsis franciscana]|uniref:histidine kinase n=1 Tax=Allocoleopsis franciscana PCC 7113 TaxID=1173027 RepID=K9WNQ1_9CYAN|nr:GAF domain-containing sensor histidine kinase [Allocoleopsis franciscana]AFZ21142.1 histidine kinase with GAF domain [Allocoleopsis franciscana PCC 7113]
MDTEPVMSSLKQEFQSRFASTPHDPNRNKNSVPLGNDSLSCLSTPVEPVFTPEQKGSLMQYTAQSAQIGQHITQIILTTPEPQTLLTKVAKVLGEIFQVDTCLVMALAQPGEPLIANPITTPQMALWCANDFPGLPIDDYSSLWEHPVLQVDWGSHQPLAISDLQTSEAWSNADGCPEGLSVRAVLKIPTWFQSAINGMIVLGRSQPHEWTTPEQDLLTLVAESVALALSHVQLTRQVLGFAHSRTLLTQLSLAMHSTDNLQEILQMAIASTAQSLQVGRGLLLLLTYTHPLGNSRPSVHLPQIKVTVAGEWLEDTAGPSPISNESPSSLLNQSFWLSESCLCQQAFRDAPAPMIISDCQESGAIDRRGESLSIFEREMMPALLIVPLIGSPSNAPAASTVLGFLVLQHCQPRPWHTDELELVEGVAAQVSAAIIQNQTLRQVQSLVEDRTAQLQHSLEIQAQLYEKTRQQIDQLQQLNQLKEEFMSSMSHELRTPLTTMSLAIRMLRQPTLPPERRQKYLEILEQECNKEIELINDLLSLQQLEADQASIQLQKIDLIRLLDPLAQSFEQKWADKRLTLKVISPAHPLILSTDPDSLNRILLELLTNAGKYSDSDTTVHLQVTRQTQPSVNQVVLTLSNTGSGISPADLDHIFDKFRRGRGVTQNAVQGTGLGLALVKCLVQHLNGTIEVSSCPLENSESSLTSFTLTLPQLRQLP